MGRLAISATSAAYEIECIIQTEPRFPRIVMNQTNQVIEKKKKRNRSFHQKIVDSNSIGKL